MIQLPDCKGIHNLSRPVLDTYFRLSELEAQGQALLLDNVLLLVGRVKKIFVYDGSSSDVDRTWKTALEFQRKHNFTMYAMGEGPLKKKSKFVEAVYDLNKVFDPTSYKNAKKRHQRLVYPTRWMAANAEVRPLTLDDWEAIHALHDEWAAFKLERPNVFRMMFSTSRYNRCCLLALNDLEQYRTIGFFYKGELVSVRVFGVDHPNRIAYDLANFCCWWRIPSQFTEYANIIAMEILYEEAIGCLNAGAQLNKDLERFKHHYPCSELVSWSYPADKVVKKDDGIWG